MNRTLLVPLLTAILVAGVAVDAEAGVGGGPFVAQLVYEAPDEASIYMVPDGSGPAFNEARLFLGGTVDATIRIQVVDHDSDPVAGYPADDMWLEFAGAAGCADGTSSGRFMADAPTDADGWTEWVLPMRGGGWSEGPVIIMINGAPAEDPNWAVVPPLALRVNSPDINGDLLVNLTDIVRFTEDLGTPSYRSDFAWDGMVNLSDIVRFTPALGATCP